METAGWEATAHPRSLEVHVASFLDSLSATGYGPRAVAHRRAIVMAFVRWTQAEQVAPQDLTEKHLAAFVNRRPQRRETRKERAALRRFLVHVRARGTPPPAAAAPISPAEALAQRYVAFLRRDRGLAENSILVYGPCARDFLTDRVAKAGGLALDALDAETVRVFLLERVAHRSPESSRLLTVSLRSLLRFLFLRSETPRDLSAAVPTIRTCRQATIRAVLLPEEMEQISGRPGSVDAPRAPRSRDLAPAGPPGLARKRDRRDRVERPALARRRDRSPREGSAPRSRPVPRRCR